MSITTFKDALLRRYPGLFVKGPDDADFECGPDALYIACELQGDGSDLDAHGNRLFDYYAEDYKEERYVMGVCHEIRDLELEHNVFIEWRNCASVGVYPA